MIATAVVLVDIGVLSGCPGALGHVAVLLALGSFECEELGSLDAVLVSGLLEKPEIGR